MPGASAAAQASNGPPAPLPAPKRQPIEFCTRRRRKAHRTAQIACLGIAILIDPRFKDKRRDSAGIRYKQCEGKHCRHRVALGDSRTHEECLHVTGYHNDVVQYLLKRLTTLPQTCFTAAEVSEKAKQTTNENLMGLMAHGFLGNILLQWCLGCHSDRGLVCADSAPL